MSELGPLAARVPEALRGASAYHVPVPPKLVAKLDANEEVAAAKFTFGPAPRSAAK